jgi:hypothetical protein
VSAPLQAIGLFLPICLMYYYSLQINKMGFKTKKKFICCRSHVCSPHRCLAMAPLFRLSAVMSRYAVLVLSQPPRHVCPAALAALTSPSRCLTGGQSPDLTAGAQPFISRLPRVSGVLASLQHQAPRGNVLTRPCQRVEFVPVCASLIFLLCVPTLSAILTL